MLFLFRRELDGDLPAEPDPPPLFTIRSAVTLLVIAGTVVIYEKAEPVGGLRFVEYLKVGVPVALLTTLAGTLLLVAFRM